MSAAPKLYLETVPSPIGDLLLGTSGEAVCLVVMGPDSRTDYKDRYLEKHYSAHQQVWARGPARMRKAFSDYFAGDLNAFAGIEAVTHGTPFQMRVWRELRRIPAGCTESYSGLARRVGNPAAVRAVGLANGRNPVPVIVPCHRVIGADGSLTGFGGGLDRKEWLLRHEGALNTLPL